MHQPRPVCLSLFLALSACTFEPEFVDITDLDRMIVGGENEPDFPAIGLVRGDGFGCTGTLIRKDAVLTAAHCISSAETMSFEVTEFVDAETTNTAIVLGRFDAKETFAHPDFDGTDLRGGNDIGIILLQDSVPEELATPLNFLQQPFTFQGEEFLAVGYGVDNPEERTGAGTKRSVVMSVSGIEDEFFIYGNFDSNTCFGDSGGPDVMNIDGVDTVVGIHSFVSATQSGPGFCRETSASTRVDVHDIDFITTILDGNTPLSQEERCAADGKCAEDCEGIDPDCNCIEDGFCDEVCTNGALMDPDCCASDFTCNESCSENGLSDEDCPVGLDGGLPFGCTISTKALGQNTKNPYGIFFSLFGVILFGLLIRFRNNIHEQ